jgi:WD40 repeat protein
MDKTARLWEVATGKEVRRLDGHTGFVHGVAFYPDGRHALSAGDQTLRRWDLDSRQSLAIWEGHTGPITCLAMSADGRLALSGDDAKMVRLWDAASGEELHRFFEHDRVRAVALSPDGRQAVSAGDDKTLRLWDLASGQLIRRFRGHQGTIAGVAFSPDGRHLLSGALDRSVRLWDLASGRELHGFHDHTDGVWCVAFTPDGRQALTGGGMNDDGGWAAGNDFALRLLRLPHTFDNLPVSPPAWAHEIRRFEGHTGDVWNVAVAADGKRALSCGPDQTVRLWDVATGKELSRFVGHTGAVIAAVFAADDRRVLSASADGTVRLWDTDNGREMRRCSGHVGRVYSVAPSSDGRRALSSGEDHTVRLWDLQTGQELKRLTGHQKEVRRVVFSPDGRRALSCGEDRTIRLWDLDAGKTLRSLEGHTQYVTSVAFSPDGRRALSSSYDNTVRMWNLDSGQELRQFEGHGDKVDYVSISGDGRRALSAGQDGLVLVWELDSGREIGFCGRDLSLVYGAVFCPDGCILSGGSDKTVHLWRLAKPGELPRAAARSHPRAAAKEESSDRSNCRKPKDEADLRYWLENMVRHHRFTNAEVATATGLSKNEIAEALKKFGLSAVKRSTRRADAPLLVLPYPGGRHPRIGWCDAAIHPQRETKVSIFAPWDSTSYVVADIPEAFRSNLGLIYLAHTHFPTIWTMQNVQLPRLEWNRRADGSLDSERKLPNGITFGTKVVPGRNGVRMEMWLTNGTKEKLTDLWVQNCVMLKGMAGFQRQTNANRVSSGSYVACHSEDGKRWVITAWHPLHRAWGIAECPCIHSDPKFPDCDPGKTQRSYGWLSFYEGSDIEAEFKRIEKMGWRVGGNKD